MSDVQQKKFVLPRFAKGMLIYALVFLAITGIGLGIFWDFMAAYEASRAKTTVNAYLQQLTEEHICDLSQTVIDQADRNIQTEEQSRQYIMDAIGEITAAKKIKESTDTRQVYVLRTGTTVIGEFSIVSTDDGKYGFKPWKFEGESFDLTALNLFGAPCEVTVPSDHTVTVNGYTLGSEYITDEKVPYEPIAEFYEDYDIPHRVTYSVAPIMGEMNVVITDPEGREVTFDENTDWTAYFHNCTEEEKTQLDAFASTFIDRYTAFTGSTRGSRYVYYNRLMAYVVPGSDFADRLWEALEGLAFGQTQGTKVVSIVTHHQVRLAENKYLCDVTYEVDTIGYKGTVRLTTNAKIVVVQTEKGLLAESVNIY